MEYNREELLGRLTDVSPAVASEGMIPELSHFWFDGKYVLAYDGGLGIRVPFKSDLECGVPGKTLLDLLKTSGLKEVSVTQDKAVTLKMGRTSIPLVSLPPSRKVWPYPSGVPKGTKPVTVTEELLNCFKTVSIIKASKPTQTVHHGVLLDPTKNAIECYTTDSRAIAKSVVKTDEAAMLERVLLPWSLVDCVAELVSPGARFYVLQDCIVVAGEKVLICCNRMDLADNPDLRAVMAGIVKDMPKLTEKPDGLQLLLGRAAILAGAKDAFVTIKTSKKDLRASGSWPLGKIDETFPFAGAVAEGVFASDNVVRALARADEMAVADNAIILHGQNLDYVAAARD